MTNQISRDFVAAAAHEIGYQIDTAWQRTGAQQVLERLNAPCGRGYLLGLFDHLLATVPVPTAEQETLLSLLYGSFIRDPDVALDIYTQRAADREDAEVRGFAEAANSDAREAATRGARSHLLGQYLEAHKPFHVTLARRG